MNAWIVITTHTDNMTSEQYTECQYNQNQNT